MTSGPENRNIRYQSEELFEYYCFNRSKWEQFYLSERLVFEKVAGSSKYLGDVLDAGCACGGLGAALCEKFSLNSYTGVDINKRVIEWARKEQELPIPGEFINADILELNLPQSYDTVVSLSCADWNIETSQIVQCCWEKVKEGGHFIISLRLTPGIGVNNINISYQFINFSEKDIEAEKANYVVFNFTEAMLMMRRLAPSPEFIGAYGYWGKTSPTAVTLYEKLVFAVFYLRKGDKPTQQIETEFNLPLDLYLAQGNNP